MINIVHLIPPPLYRSPRLVIGQQSCVNIIEVGYVSIPLVPAKKGLC
uniref:Uncharacterized protein n=1 Tax=Arundo donax TaxID=35708 RepID=A0A0A8YQP2_ARUDO